LIFDILYLILLWEGVSPRGWAGRWASIQVRNKTPNQIPKQNSNPTRKQARNQAGNQARIQARNQARIEAGEFTRGWAGKQPGIEAGRLTPEQAGIQARRQAPLIKFSISKSQISQKFKKQVWGPGGVRSCKITFYDKIHRGFIHNKPESSVKVLTHGVKGQGLILKPQG
jgi:hypothetical protein